MTTEANIYKAIGRGLAEWSRVEFAFNLLFLALNGRKLRANDPLLAAFEANKSFDPKRKMMLTFVNSDPGLSDTFRKQFTSLDRKLAECAGLRAHIAHFELRTHHDRKRPEGEVMLHPFGTFTGTYFERDRPPLSASQLEQRADKFAALAERVFRFVSYLKQTKGLLERFDDEIETPERLLDHPFTGHYPMVVTFGVDME